MNSTPYREDIDGLRAIAVLSVIGFHAFPDLVAGGFIGVDVFFVISGFLISGIIAGSLQKGDFSFARFYARRVRRIFPALILVMAACYLFGWFVLLPDEYEQLGKHIAAGAGFLSNLFYWQEAGYFDNVAGTKPLLHVWSLGIEEQFYIVWPLLLYLVWKRRFDPLILVIFVAILSFAANVGTVSDETVQAFYSPLTRLWELLIGSILVFQRQFKIDPWEKVRHATCSVTANVRSISGVLLIAISVLFIDREEAFPGWWAMLPTLGTFLIISAGPNAWFNRIVLSQRFLVWVGLISYPLYLWHWPLLSFAQIIEGGTPALGIRIALVLISIVLAWMTYMLVESPVRGGSHSGAKVAVLCGLMIIVGSIGFATYQRDGLPFRYAVKDTMQKNNDLAWKTSSLGYTHCSSVIARAAPSIGYCWLSSRSVPSFAIFGDSHADHIFHGLANIDRGRSWLLIGSPSCPPVSGIRVGTAEKECQQITQSELEFIINVPSIHTVALSFFGNYASEISYAKNHIINHGGPSATKISSDEFRSGNKLELFYLGLEKTVRELESHGKSVIVIIDVPELPFLPRDCMRSALFGGSDNCKLTTSEVLGRQKVHREMLQRLADAHPKLQVYDPLGMFCNKQNCNFETGEVLLYRDSHHLSLRGSAIFAENFLRWISPN